MRRGRGGGRGDGGDGGQPGTLFGTLLFSAVDEVRVVLLHDLVHIEDGAVLLREDARGADPCAGGALFTLAVKVAAGLASPAFLARDARNESWLDLCHYCGRMWRSVEEENVMWEGTSSASVR